MADLAHELTDRELTALEKKIAAAYERARDKVQERADKFFDTFREDAEKLYKAISDAPDATTRLAAEKAYKDFVWRKTVSAKNITDLRDKLAADMTALNQNSAKLIGQRMNNIFSLNHNFAAYTLEHDLGRNLRFSLYDEKKLDELIDEDPRYFRKPKIDKRKDENWNKQLITGAITAAILLGLKLKDIAKSIDKVVDNNANSAKRNAELFVMQAADKGQDASYEYAKEIGLEIEKEWVATLDDKTRDAHQELDGQVIDDDEYFEVDGERIFEPRDPNAAGYLIYNCRCELARRVKGVSGLDEKYRADNIDKVPISDMSYREWEAARRG